MSGDTIFRNLVHFVGADLDFKGFVEACHHGGVQGLIVVCLGHCDIILESARHRLPKIVDKAKECVAILDGISDYADGKQVVDLVNVNVCLSYLFEYGIIVLWSAVDFTVNAQIFQFLGEGVADLLQKHLALTSYLLSAGHDVLIFRRIKVFHCKVFKFTLEERNTKSACKRSVNVQGFL